jgi:hypothetical protein
MFLFLYCYWWCGYIARHIAILVLFMLLHFCCSCYNNVVVHVATLLLFMLLHCCSQWCYKAVVSCGCVQYNAAHVFVCVSICSCGWPAVNGAILLKRATMWFTSSLCCFYGYTVVDVAMQCCSCGFPLLFMWLPWCSCRWPTVMWVIFTLLFMCLHCSPKYTLYGTYDVIQLFFTWLHCYLYMHSTLPELILSGHNYNHTSVC